VRSKEFDPDVALDRAMDLFWTQGYEATGVADLVEHLGVARASLYATFGSKATLYLLALDRYCDQVAGPVIDALEQPGPVLPRIRAMLEHLAAVAELDADRRGCLVVNAAMERVPADGPVTARIVDHLDKDVDVLSRALQRARDQGEIGADADPVALARFLVTTILGLRVVGKATARSDVLDDVVAVALGALR